MQKNTKNSKILKNYGHFRIPRHKISVKQFSNICENVVYFFLLCRGVEKWLRIFAKQIKKRVNLVFFLHFATTTHCNFKFWKIDPPYCIYRPETRYIPLHLFAPWQTGFFWLLIRQQGPCTWPMRGHVKACVFRQCYTYPSKPFSRVRAQCTVNVNNLKSVYCKAL